MSKKILRLLIVDESPDDADAVCKDLRVARFMLKSQRVMDASSMQSALDKSTWDIVLSEHDTPGFGTQQVLQLLRRNKLTLPLIVYTKDIDDKSLIKVMRDGACDVVHKTRAARLVPAIERELALAKERKHSLRTMDAMREAEDKHRAIVQGAREAVCYCHEGMHIEVNQAYLDMFGYDSMDELEGVPLLNLLERSQHQKLKDGLRKISKGVKLDEALEFQAAKKDGSRFDIEMTIMPVNIKGEECIQFAVADITKRKVAEDRLKYLSQRDPLTGLYNRHYFQQLLSSAIEQTKSGGDKGALIYIDLYNLQKINSSLGYTAGDRMLLKISKLFRDNLDDSAVLARIGGLEFAVLINDTDKQDPVQTSNALKSILKASPLCEHGKQYHCDCALAVLPVDSESTNARDILTKAQNNCAGFRVTSTTTKMQTTDKKSKANAKVDDNSNDKPSTTVKADNTDSWVQRIVNALNNNAFKLVYQPIINLHGNPGEYYEVLIRMQGDDNKLILPHEFMPEAERSGLINAIDKWVLQNAVESQAVMQQEGRTGTFFINLSAATFTDDGFIEYVASALKQHNVLAKHTVFELDEPAVVQDPKRATKFITKLCDLGCQVSLDNFGKGFDTLLNLPRKSIKFLKIDASSITQTSTDADKEALDALMAMTKKLEIKTVAKCIENASSLTELWRYGFDYVQGNYFQQADSDLNYEFAAEDEATLSSDGISSWHA